MAGENLYKEVNIAKRNGHFRGLYASCKAVPKHHARSGVACADCRMPCTRVGAQKISDHHQEKTQPQWERRCR